MNDETLNKNVSLLAVNEVLDDSSDCSYQSDDQRDQEYYARMYGAIGDERGDASVFGIDLCGLSDSSSIEDTEEYDATWDPMDIDTEDSSYDEYREEVDALFAELENPQPVSQPRGIKRKREDLSWDSDYDPSKKFRNR